MTYCKEVESSTNKRKTFIVEIGFDMESTRDSIVRDLKNIGSAWSTDLANIIEKG